jgi:coproporphyrinogen III oxidase-like Fe-S oxidoreductase
VNKPIGITVGHGEQVVPSNPEYSLFFEMLRAQGLRTETIESLTPERLKEFGALLIGEVHGAFEAETSDALYEWVRGGGRLLVLSTVAGEATGTKEGESASGVFLFELIEGFGFCFGHGILAVSRGIVEARHAFDSKVPIDLSGFAPGVLCYDTGCEIDLDEIGLDGKSMELGLQIKAPASALNVGEMRLEGGQVRGGNFFKPRRAEGWILLEVRHGTGSVFAMGSSWCFKDDTLIRMDNVRFLNALALHWLNLAPGEVERRMQRPQRHRLLHGYPMSPLMNRVAESTSEDLVDVEAGISVDTARKLVVGVLPHSFCNPQVKGCGFCTFPHEVYRADAAQQTMQNVAKESRLRVSQIPEFQGKRKVEALYFGGGTANLGPVEAFRELAKTLGDTFDLSGAEVTLEGVPGYFLTHKKPHLEVLHEALPDSRLRLSMGVQTLDERRLRAMGRSAFGDLNTVRAVVKHAHSLGATVSGDLLFNLPGQKRDAMRDDVVKLIDAGVDHLCLYHLVLFEGLGTEWSRDPALLAGLPGNAEACANWADLRAHLEACGFTQRTLTNFERSDHLGTDRSFGYELNVMQPETYDWLGFGPGAISFVADRKFDRAIKLLNPESSQTYNQAVESAGRIHEGYFAYSLHGLKILYVTRKIASLGISREAYKTLFHSDVVTDFAAEWAALEARELVKIDGAAVRLTVPGMFYADTVAGTIAWRESLFRRLEGLKEGRIPEPDRKFYGEATPHRMG